VEQCHEGGGHPEHINETGFARVLLACKAPGGMVLRDLRTPLSSGVDYSGRCRVPDTSTSGVLQ